jgi:hypothetical protein
VNGSSWYRSFYWRIAISFVVFVVAVFVAQSIMFSYMIARSGAAGTASSPNTLAMAIAADIGSALSADPRLDIRARLADRFAGVRQPIYVVLTDGRTAGNTAQPIDEGLRTATQTAIAGRTTVPALPIKGRGPVVMSPLLVDGVLRGMVVLPPPPGGIARDVGRILSLPGIVLLVVATAVAAIVILHRPAGG